MTIQLSPHFTLEELAVTLTGLKNVPSREHIANLRRLANEFLEPVRAVVYGGKPLIVDSGFRSPAVNAAVGGSKNSRHLIGLVADFRLPRPASPNETLASRVEYVMESIGRMNIPFDQLIYERRDRGEGWIHGGLDIGRLRQQVLMSFRSGKFPRFDPHVLHEVLDNAGL